ncbi:MAG: PAS domain-containing protein [Planctomycetes bacterium]|nr:PAS domain-containing protein [Planctomycetota bacterium]
MTRPTTRPTNVERFFDVDDIIVSKTDTKGIITYANQVFIDIAGYTEEELLGQNHNVIRHPDMPRCVFKLLWDTIAQGQEIFAYVKNMAKGGDHYWVWAHVTPTFGPDGKIIGYHSSRRVPERAAVEKAEGLYATLREIEHKGGDGSAAMAQSFQAVVDLLTEAGIEYDEFAFSL